MMKLAVTALASALFSGAIMLLPVVASPLAVDQQFVKSTLAADDTGAAVTKIGYKKRRFDKKSYKRHHRNFHKRYDPKRRHYKKAHRKFHRHYKRRHKGPSVYFDIYPGYYDPFYYNPYYYDPYFYNPPRRHRISCNRARRIVRNHGYRHVRASDCKGKVYGFRATKKGRRYKLRVSARTGAILSRRRY